MNVEINGIEAIDIDLREIPDRISSRVLVRALNRSISSGRTVMVRAMAGDTGLRSKDVRDAMVMREASSNRLEASLAARLKRIPLIDFKAKGPEPSRGKGRGVSYRLPGGAGRIENAFIATMRSGHRGVYKRRTKDRLPIDELKGPSLGQVFRKFRPAGVARVTEVFDANFDHELSFAIRGTGAGSGGSDAVAD